MKQPLSLSSLFALFLALPFVFSACNSDDEGGEPPRPTESIMDIIIATEGLDSLAEYLKPYSAENEIYNRLSKNELTVFAPNNEAFAKLVNAIGLRSMAELRSSLFSDILFYHIVANTAIRSNQLDSTVTAFNNGLITLTTEGDSVLLNRTTQPDRTTIVSPDIRAANGVVHVINEVLLPTSMLNLAPTFGTLAGLTSTLFIPIQRPDGSLADGGLTTIGAIIGQSGGQFNNVLTGTASHTVLAPVNEAFSNYFLSPSLEINDIANYHVIPGNVDLAAADKTVTTLGGEVLYVHNLNGALFLNGTQFFDLGYTASNGKLLLSTEALRPATPLVEVIANVGAVSGASFTIFNTALEQTDIDLGTGKTIFVPTDQAFRDAGLVTSIDSASRIDPAVLANVLQTHVFEGVNFSFDIVAAEPLEVTALNGATLNIAIAEDGNSQFIRIQDTNDTSEDAAVVLFDNLSDNGVVHVIDKLLLP